MAFANEAWATSRSSQRRIDCPVRRCRGERLTRGTNHALYVMEIIRTATSSYDSDALFGWHTSETRTDACTAVDVRDQTLVPGESNPCTWYNLRAMVDRSIRNLWLVATLMTLGGTLTGCPGNYPACRQDQDCKSGLSETCIDGNCQNCVTDLDCEGMAPAGQEPFLCQNFRCQSEQLAFASDLEPGAPCTERSQCSQQLACREGICSSCFDEVDCGGLPCDAGTGRCAPPTICVDETTCLMDEICDNGACVSSNLDITTGPCGLRAVFFAFDSDSLTSEAEQELSTFASCLKSESRSVYLEAHADNRGTEEYNIMLTERRGTEVRSYLLGQGINGDSLQVIAKGSLEATGVDEQSRAGDRRVELVWP